MDSLGDELELALQLADAADVIALRHFRDPDLAVETKPDGSPVSSADRQIELELRAILEHRRPGDAILGEEGGASGDADHRWYLDPIDGTGNFVATDPEWYILIALAVDGEAVVGVVSAPALGERWWASRGAGAFRDGSLITVSAVGELADATVADDWQRRLARGVTGHPLATLAGATARVRPHSGHSHLEVASGEADLTSGTGFAWDFAPTKVIVEAAGGRFTDLRGRDAFDTGDALVSNGRIHDQGLQVLKSRT
jgi:histidinol-phosphatase